MAEDDPPIRALLRATVEDEVDVQLLVASDGEEAIQLAKEHSPDLVFLDVQMPMLDGIEACRRLKSDPDTSHTTIVIVTALGMETTRQRALEAGADRFMTKPFSPRQVSQVLREARGDLSSRPSMACSGHPPE